MAAKSRKKRPPVSDLAKKTTNLGDVKWNKSDQTHSWSCDNCGETLKAAPDRYNKRLSLSQFSMENNTKVIWGKAMDHVRRNCAPEPKPAYRKDLD
jgi:hypothetical protein